MLGKLTLKVTKGPIQGQVLTFDEHDTFIFGRSHDCYARLSEKDPSDTRY